MIFTNVVNSLRGIKNVEQTTYKKCILARAPLVGGNDVNHGNVTVDRHGSEEEDACKIIEIFHSFHNLKKTALQLVRSKRSLSSIVPTMLGVDSYTRNGDTKFRVRCNSLSRKFHFM